MYEKSIENHFSQNFKSPISRKQARKRANVNQIISAFLYKYRIRYILFQGIGNSFSDKVI